MRRTSTVSRLVMGLFVGLALALAAPTVALAQTTFNVNTNADTDAVNPAVGCNDSSGNCSLRGAIEAANQVGTGSVAINLPADSTVGGPYTLSMGELTLNPTVPVTITGTGTCSGSSCATIIDAADQSRAIEIGSKVDQVITISNVEMRNGRPTDIADATACENGDPRGCCPTGPETSQSGGAILDGSANELLLSDDLFLDNLVEGDGGAVEVYGSGELSVSGSWLIDNTACQPSVPIYSGPPFGNGGAIDESGGATVVIDTSTMSGNSAYLNGGGVSEAGGRPDPGLGGALTITNSTISGNTVTSNNGNGGGVYGQDNGGTINLFADEMDSNSAAYGGAVGGYDTNTITNTTIYNNTASVLGGGVDGSQAPTTISFSTINDNQVVGEGDGGNIGTSCGSDCGGSVPTVDDSIITGGSPDNCGPFPVNSNGYNLFDNNGNDCGANTGNGDQINTNPLLGPLQNNGGPTQTEALLSGSPAIDKANPDLSVEGPCVSEAQNVDQRGVVRPQGTACDIGAFEFKRSGGGGRGKTTASISTTVFDTNTRTAWAGTETAGASAYDTTNLGGTLAGQTPSGTITYSLFDNGTCSGAAASTDTETLNSDGSVPNSKPSGALAAGSYSYQASWPGDSNYTASTGPCEPFTVKPGQPDLTLTSSPESNPIVVGQQDTVTDSITNVGDGNATGVQFTDPAAGFAIDSVTSSQGSCTHTATTVSCSLGTIAAGHSATVKILVRPSSTGTVTLDSSVSMNQTDPTPGNDHATARITVNRQTKPLADLAVSILPSADRVSTGHVFYYRLVLSNHGPDAGHHVAVTDHLPGRVTLVSIRAGRGVHCTGTSTVRCAFADLPTYLVRSIRLVVRAKRAGLARDVARISDASPTDPNLRNNMGRAAVTLLGGPTISIKTLGPACYFEASTIQIRAVALASAGIKEAGISVSGHGFNRGQSVARAPGGHSKPTHHLSIGMVIKGADLLAGRTYNVLATVVDELGRRALARSHFTICNPHNKPGFTG